MPLDKFSQNGLSKDAEKIAEPDSQKGETGYTSGPAAFLSKDNGVGDEAEVEDSVDDADVGVPEDARYGISRLSLSPPSRKTAPTRSAPSTS